MSEQQQKREERPNQPRMNRQPGNENNQPKKGPKFSVYWIYAIIFAVLIGFQVFGLGSTNMAKIDQQSFVDILKKGDVEKYVVISNRNVVRIYLKQESLSKYQDKLKKGFTGKINEDGPQMYFRVVSGDSFQDDMRQFYTQNPDIIKVGTADTEKDWIGGALQFLLPILIIVGLWVLLMRKMSGGAGGGGGPGGIFNIGKSKATLFDKGTKVNITFADVAGLDEAKVEVMEIVDFLKTPKKYTALGGKIPKGALLVGPPGTGKTLLAKAMAGEAQVPFYSLSGSDFVEMFVGVGASRVRDLFKQAREKAPCIKRSRTRLAPTPTNISTKSDPLRL